VLRFKTSRYIEISLGANLSCNMQFHANEISVPLFDESPSLALRKASGCIHGRGASDFEATGSASDELAAEDVYGTRGCGVGSAGLVFRDGRGSTRNNAINGVFRKTRRINTSLSDTVARL
jgi:hypothetical protein